ncbi:metal-dependent hydrolase [Halobacillus shinanisalinarum]|uniref:Metal-dependent hydrolase n=1 Tax=Halobacillus shinanisalinarum TaxID=2932258 RepID=A0ABY4GV30_9BACI|nr:metal-dependent hydrolase [Halobacillus shinanisalinarum]UOQ91758.1 metal-dependent hydrolase [Halobacillus shinanisalinarum]
MMAPGHQVVGFTCGVVAMTLLPKLAFLPQTPLQTILFFAFVLFGALLPDIDTPRSTLGKKFWRILMLILLAVFLLYLFSPGFFDVYRDELKIFVIFMLPLLIMVRSHRKMTHSFLFVLLLGLYSYLIDYFFTVPSYYFLGIMIGTLSHLLGDVVTCKGIPLLYPLTKKHFRFFLTFKTGSQIEKIIVFALSIWNIWFLMTQFF